MTTSNIQAFTLRCIDKFGGKFDYTDSVYTAYKKPISIKCKLHDRFQTTPIAHIEFNHGMCNGCKISYLFEEFKSKITEKFGNQFSFEKTIYTNNYKDKILLTCREHGDFITSANNLIKSVHGCPECHTKYKDRYKFKTPEDAIECLKALHIFDFEDFDLKVNELLTYIKNPISYNIIFENNKRTHNNLEFYGQSFIVKT